MRRLILAAAGALLIALSAAPLAAQGPFDQGEDVKLVVMLTRHGVRSPIFNAGENVDALAAQPWPVWEVPPSYLTPHGKQQMALMGAYYRAVFTAEGVLTGAADQDQSRVYFRADSDQRTIETARDLAAGLLPGTPAEVHARPQDHPDPLYTPYKFRLGNPDPALAIAAVSGRIGGDPQNLLHSLAPELRVLQEVMFGPGAGTLPGKVALLDLPCVVAQGKSDHIVDIHGSLEEAMRMTDRMILEYTDGMPLSQVGWGRVTPATLTTLLRLHSLYFDFTQRTFYPAQVQSSNLASHILDTLRQAADGQTRPGAVAPASAKLVLLIGHDTNIANLSGLLGLNWWLSGTQENPILPGGALIFELRQRRADGAWRIRAYYVCQSFDQMRSGQALTLEAPPPRAPIFIPGCSEAGPGFEAPFPAFEALLQRVIDPKFVLPSSQ